MIEIIAGIQEQLQSIESIQYVDEDWGQLDYFSPNFPVKFPCVLIDIQNADYSDIGRDENAKPINRQVADINISLTVANMRLTNTSGMASTFQKEQVRSLHNLIEEIHIKLHGKKANELTGVLSRKSLNRIKRDDGVQEYNIIYYLSVTNV